MYKVLQAKNESIVVTHTDRGPKLKSGDKLKKEKHTKGEGRWEEDLKLV